MLKEFAHVPKEDMNIALCHESQRSSKEFGMLDFPLLLASTFSRVEHTHCPPRGVSEHLHAHREVRVCAQPTQCVRQLIKSETHSASRLQGRGGLDAVRT